MARCSPSLDSWRCWSSDSQMAAGLELVIFDCDGVLVDSEVISNRVLARLLRGEGLSRELADTRRDYQGLLLDEIATRAEHELGQPLPADFLERFQDERAEEFRRELRAVWGAAETVQPE